MSVTEELRAAVKKKEEEQVQIEQDPNRLKLHLMPPTGWLNDPNGLCYFQGKYHVFYQYSPLDPQGGDKLWGHYVSENLVEWKQLEAPLFPDQAFDRDGVYSGSAFIENEKMYLFYTGNVKQEGTYDYVYQGREANTIRVTSEDGVHFFTKELLMANEDYPLAYSCHIRDPKVWKEGNSYYMIQGGRKKKYEQQEENSQDTDYGTALIFRSDDLLHWNFQKDITTQERFGYMWECPDYFILDGKPVLSVSPQGLEAQEYKYQNVYQSGYFLLDKELVSKTEPERMVNAEKFHEWDAGFDFYAPQTFCDEKGRRILWGWAGIPDAEYDNEPTVEKGWQHALTLPRELTWKEGRILQNPVEEIRKLRKEPIYILESYRTHNSVFELAISEIPGACRVTMGNGAEAVCLSYEAGVLKLKLTDEAGRGRGERKIFLKELRNLQIIVDTSMVEIYINDGESVMTSRFYFPDDRRKISVQGAYNRCLWYLQGLEVQKG